MEKFRGMTSQERGKGNRVVLVPFPAAGHMNPMIQLGTLFYSKGFSITIFHAPSCLLPSSISQCFDLKPFPGNLPKHLDMKDLYNSIANINSICKDNVLNYLSEMIKKDGLERIACVVSDPMMYFCQSFVDQFEVPQFILRTSGANTFLASYILPLMLQKGLSSSKDDSEELVIEIPPLRKKDIPRYDSNYQDVLKLNSLIYNKSIKWSGLIWNTFQYLEQSALDEIHKNYEVPVFTFGPLHKHAPLQASINLMEQNGRCLEWLDKQKHNSVLYVSFGTIASIEKPQFEEIAWGLANCKLPFLWVLRPDLVHGSTSTLLPEGFEEEIQQRGLVIEWAPQLEVLAHKAVGGFWTHGGWNSTLESVCEGVPMLCWPCFGDQFVNTRIITYVWKVGIVIEGGLERGLIEKDIRRLMVGKEGEEMKKRIEIFKENAENCLKEGGSSYESLHKFMDCILPN